MVNMGPFWTPVSGLYAVTLDVSLSDSVTTLMHCLYLTFFDLPCISANAELSRSICARKVAQVTYI